jgi:glycosyltransferase involved in cell wall biosynthesis
VLTLHDAWLLSGHCAHSFDCERWKTGCGRCPDLSIYPAVKRDATAYNWRRKRNIYAQSRVYVATPSRWLMRKVEQSILALAIVEARVIPYGVDLTIFHPGDRREARAMLGIPLDAKVLLFVGNATRSNPWRDYATLEAAVERVAERLPDERVILVCLGEARKPERIGEAEVQFIGYRKEPTTVARFYQAADIYLHGAKADTFPNVVLEALACGTPVVATAVGGIPEQVKNGVTGFLVQPRDVKAMAEAIITLLTDDALRMRLGRNAAEDARRRFDLNRQAEAYLGWYQELVANWLSPAE